VGLPPLPRPVGAALAHQGPRPRGSRRPRPRGSQLRARHPHSPTAIALQATEIACAGHSVTRSVAVPDPKHRAHCNSAPYVPYGSPVVERFLARPKGGLLGSGRPCRETVPDPRLRNSGPCAWRDARAQPDRRGDARSLLTLGCRRR